MNRAVWVHQWSQLGEQSAQEVAITLASRGIYTVYVKAMDGVDWMGVFYDHPLAPYNMAAWVQSIHALRNVGIKLLPWVVNHTASSEAYSHIECGRAAGGLIVDFEYHYAGFWSGTPGAAQVYFDILRNQAPDIWLAVAPDPRQVGRDYNGNMLERLHILPQTYWTDFQRPAIEVLNQAWSMPIPDIKSFEPILPANSAPGDMLSALEWCVASGVTDISLWRMGTANASQLDAFAQRVPGEEVPNVDDTERQQMQAKIDGLVNALGYVAGDVIRPLIRPSAPKYVKTAVEKIRTVAEQQNIGHA